MLRALRQHPVERSTGGRKGDGRTDESAPFRFHGCGVCSRVAIEARMRDDALRAVICLRQRSADWRRISDNLDATASAIPATLHSSRPGRVARHKTTMVLVQTVAKTGSLQVQILLGIR